MFGLVPTQTLRLMDAQLASSTGSCSFFARATVFRWSLSVGDKVLIDWLAVCLTLSVYTCYSKYPRE